MRSFMNLLFGIMMLFAVTAVANAGEIISTTDAPAAVGPYSQAVKTGCFVFASGQIALDPQTGKLVEGGIREQTEQVMKNIAAILKAADCDFCDVVKTTCFLADINDFAAFNEIYAQYFTEKPARSCIAAAALPKGALLELEVIICKPCVKDCPKKNGCPMQK